MKIGVFHSGFNSKGGGEEVAYSLAKALDLREVYTMRSEGYRTDIKTIDVSQSLPAWAKLSGKLMKRFPSFDYFQWEMIDVEKFGDFDIIISSGTSLRSLILPEHILHVHYLHTVPRWLYDLWHYHPKRKFITFITAEMARGMDSIVDNRVDHYIVNSELIQRRLWKYYKRDSKILYPPINSSRYNFKKSGDFLLHANRFEKEKQILPVIKACEKTNTKLILIGEKGSDEESLKYAMNSNIAEYLGYVSLEEKLELLSNCKAVIYNAKNEDFGIVPIEALASGKPVIVNNTGYPPIIIRKTGFLSSTNTLNIYKGGIITDGSIESISSAVRALDDYEWSPLEIIEFAKEFDLEVFRKNMIEQLKIWKDEYDSYIQD